MKILFLDVDGVLNSDRSMTLLAISKPAVRRLKYIVGETGCHIVVSSTWRRIADARKKLETVLGYHGLKIHSYTTSEYWEIGQIRGDEIDEWLTRWPEITKYVIVDDNTDFHPHQMPFFVQTNGHVGLTDADSNTIIKLLNGE